MSTGHTDPSGDAAPAEDHFHLAVACLKSEPIVRRTEMLFAILLAVVAAYLAEATRAAVRPLPDHPASQLPPWVTLLYLFGALMFLWHMWLFYTEILFYREHSRYAWPTTILVATAAVIGVTLSPSFDWGWSLFYPIWTFAIFIKCLQVKYDLRSAAKQPHPFAKHVNGWITASLLYTIVLVVLVFFISVLNVKAEPPAWLTNLIPVDNWTHLARILLPLLVIIVVSYRYFGYFKSLREQIEEGMRDYWGIT